MNGFDELERDLRDALSHLYDPLYEPPASLWTVMGVAPEQGLKSLQSALIEAIEELEPTSPVPQHAPIKRLYELLSYRYVQGLTQESTAEHLGITPRYLREQQWKAVRVLARSLWKRAQVGKPPIDDLWESEPDRSEFTSPRVESPGWSFQVREELTSLHRSAPHTVADVDATILATAELARTLTGERDIVVEVDVVEPDVTAMIHPSALRQVLLAAIEDFARDMSSGALTLCGEREGDNIRITVTRRPAGVNRSHDIPLVREVLTMYRGSVESHTEGNRRSLLMRLPAASQAEKAIVLVVDDNADLVSFYQAYTAGTRYEIVPVFAGQHAFQAIEASKPHIIVLDVMLPDIDGWELLVQLHGHPTTHAIPVIVCSVIRDEELALALGATLYVPKPVRRQQFIRALDRALNQVASGASRAAANSAAAC